MTSIDEIEFGVHYEFDGNGRAVYIPEKRELDETKQEPSKILVIINPNERILK
jgi:hypothetical protein